MSEKSFISMEQNVCVVCGATYDTGSLLLDQRLRNRMEMKTVTGWGLCPEHQKMFDEDFIALIECDPKLSGLSDGSTNVQPDKAYRTGHVAHLKRSVFHEIFDTTIQANQACVFIEPGVIEKLQSMIQD